MKARLKLDIIDKDGNLLRSQEQESRSFTKNFITGLYKMHSVATIPSGMAYTISDDDLNDSVSGLSTGYLDMAGVNGWNPSIYSYYAGFNYTSYSVRPKGIWVGGGGDIAAAPLDRALRNRTSHGIASPAAGTNFEYYDTGDDQAYTAYGINWIGQNIQLQTYRAWRLTSIYLLLYKTGNPGLITVSIRKSTGVQTDLVSATSNGDTLPPGAPYEWRQFVLNYPLDAAQSYFICVRALAGDASNKVHWRYDSSGATYAGGAAYYSINSGVGWSGVGGTSGYMFRCNGDAVGDFQVGGMNFTLPITYSAPNVDFSMWRYFTNSTASTITINEAGIIAFMYANPYLVLRDVVAPSVPVLTTEILKTTYTFRTTV